MKPLRLVAASLVALVAQAHAQPDPAPTAAPRAGTPAPLPQAAAADAKLYFIAPVDGAEVTNPVRVVFGLSAMGVAPAGVDRPGTGHHHLLIDSPAVDLSLPLPASDQIRHFGGGQTETTLTLSPGTHTLQLLLGDWKHQPHHTPVLSEKITITVKPSPTN